MRDRKTALPKKTSLQRGTTNPSLPTNPSLRGGTTNSNQSLRGGTTKQSLTPELRFQEFEGEWDFSKMLDISSKITDGTHDTPVKAKEGIPYLTAVHVKDGFIDFDNCYYLKQKDHDSVYKRCNPELGDLLIVNIGAGTGTCAGVSVDYPFSLKNVALVKPNREVICDDYLIQLQRNKSKRLFHQLTSGGAQPFFSLKQIGKLKVEFPTLPEQQKIASFLSSVDKKIQLLTKKKTLLEDYKKGVMQQLFSGELRFKPNVFVTAACLAVTYDEANSSTKTEYPEWKWVGGNVLFDNISDKKHNSDLPILAITQDQGAIPRDLINYKMIVTEKSVASYKVVQIGDFVISLRTFQGGIEFSDYHGICSPAYIILRPSSEDVNRDFYKYYLKTSNYIKQLQKNLEGIRDGKMISYKYFSEIKVPFPSYNEQQKIASYLSAIDRKIEAVTHQISQTQSFKKGLLQKMFV